MTLCNPVSKKLLSYTALLYCFPKYIVLLNITAPWMTVNASWSESMVGSRDMGPLPQLRHRVLLLKELWLRSGKDRINHISLTLTKCYDNHKTFCYAVVTTSTYSIARLDIIQNNPKCVLIPRSLFFHPKCICCNFIPTQ